MAGGDLAGADTALQGLDKFNGFQLVKTFQLGLLYDFAGKPDKAEDYYNKALAAGEQLNWRVVDVVANFDTRRGHSDLCLGAAPEASRTGSGQRAGRSLRSRLGNPQDAAAYRIRSPADGLGEALSDPGERAGIQGRHGRSRRWSTTASPPLPMRLDLPASPSRCWPMC